MAARGHSAIDRANIRVTHHAIERTAERVMHSPLPEARERCSAAWPDGCTTIYVRASRLPAPFDESLKAVFSAFGDIESVRVKIREDGSLQCAFIRYVALLSARHAYMNPPASTTVEPERKPEKRREPSAAAEASTPELEGTATASGVATVSEAPSPAHAHTITALTHFTTRKVETATFVTSADGSTMAISAILSHSHGPRIVGMPLTGGGIVKTVLEKDMLGGEAKFAARQLEKRARKKLKEDTHRRKKGGKAHKDT